MNHESKLGKHDWTTFVVLSAFLVLSILWRIITPGGYSSSSVRYMSMGFDLLMLAGLVGLKFKLTAALPVRDDRRSISDLLFWPALVAGFGLFLIRFTSNTGWMTGHLY